MARPVQGRFVASTITVSPIHRGIDQTRDKRRAAAGMGMFPEGMARGLVMGARRFADGKPFEGGGG
jgi:hypothetical protein